MARIPRKLVLQVLPVAVILLLATLPGLMDQRSDRSNSYSQTGTVFVWAALALTSVWLWLQWPRRTLAYVAAGGTALILLMRPVAVLLAIQDWGSPIIMKTLLGFAVMTYSLRGQRITKDMIDAINEQPEVRMLDLADCVIDDDAIASLFPINVSCIICVDDAEYDSDAFQALLYKRPYINVTELKHERTFDRYGAFYRSR